MSQILPGGHTGLDGSPMEKLYLVLEGQLARGRSRLDGAHQEEQCSAPTTAAASRPARSASWRTAANRPVLVALVMAERATRPERCALRSFIATSNKSTETDP